jgi:hypothetical protein
VKKFSRDIPAVYWNGYEDGVYSALEIVEMEIQNIHSESDALAFEYIASKIEEKMLEFMDDRKLHS